MRASVCLYDRGTVCFAQVTGMKAASDVMSILGLGRARLAVAEAGLTSLPTNPTTAGAVQKGGPSPAGAGAGASTSTSSSSSVASGLPKAKL